MNTERCYLQLTMKILLKLKNIILINAFLKKSNKDYRKQIKIAESILNRLEL